MIRTTDRLAAMTDYLRVTNLKAGDTIQLISGRYLIDVTNTTGLVSLYRDITGNGLLDTGRKNTDELIAQFDSAAQIFANVNFVYV